MKFRYMLMTALVAFAVALAIIVGKRLSSEAMAVMVGVVAGVAASIPTSLIVVWVATRNSEPRVVEMPHAPPAPEPKIVVVTQPAQPAPMPAGYAFPAAYTAPPLAAGPRTFTVIGGNLAEEDAGGDTWLR